MARTSARAIASRLRAVEGLARDLAREFERVNTPTTPTMQAMANAIQTEVSAVVRAIETSRRSTRHA
jgi:hypothetical protein